MNTILNTYQCCKSPIVHLSVPLEAILEEIKTGKSYGKVIETARYFGKGSEPFEAIKSTQIPTYTVNATFEGKRAIENIVSMTGLLYIDIDGTTDIDISHPLIYATFKSVSATGRGVIVRVEGLNQGNIKPIYEYVELQLGVKVDSSCAELSRQAVLSYDPGVVINPHSRILTNSDIKISAKGYNEPFFKIEEKGKNSLMYPSSILPKEPNENINTKNKLRYSNIDEYDIDGYFRIFDRKERVIEVYIPRVIYNGHRHNTISLIATNLCYLNPEIRAERLKGLLHNINQRCEEPLTNGEISKIFKQITKRIAAGQLKPIYNRFRKVIFSPDCPEDFRKQVRGIASGLVRSENTLNKIKSALDDWDLLQGKITNQGLAIAADIHLNTVKKYLKDYPELKEQKDIINNAC